MICPTGLWSTVERSGAPQTAIVAFQRARYFFVFCFAWLKTSRGGRPKLRPEVLLWWDGSFSPEAFAPAFCLRLPSSCSCGLDVSYHITATAEGQSRSSAGAPASDDKMTTVSQRVSSAVAIQFNSILLYPHWSSSTNLVQRPWKCTWVWSQGAVLLFQSITLQMKAVHRFKFKSFIYPTMHNSNWQFSHKIQNNKWLHL